MQLKNFATLVSVATLACSVALVSTNQSAIAKSKKHYTPSNHRYSNYFVPPPPAYVPSILPERMMNTGASASTEEAAADPDESEAYPYKKYIYTRQGSDAPRVVQPNKYVTYWNRT
jgi:hypothetical protein